MKLVEQTQADYLYIVYMYLTFQIKEHLVIAQLVERLTVGSLHLSIGHWFDSGSRDSFAANTNTQSPHHHKSTSYFAAACIPLDCLARLQAYRMFVTIEALLSEQS